MQENNKRMSKKEGEEQLREKQKLERILHVEELTYLCKTSVYDLHLYRIGYCCTERDH